MAPLNKKRQHFPFEPLLAMSREALDRATVLLGHITPTHCADVEDASQDLLIDRKQKGKFEIVTIELNKPRSLNALNLAMVEKILGTLKTEHEKLIEDPELSSMVLLQACPGSKAFCAGGDIRTLAEACMVGNYQVPAAFFSTEYRMNACLGYLHRMAGTIPMTVVALVDGICMGGGVGLSFYASICVVTEKLVFAMPETGIGFFPDIGASFFLPRLPGAIGMYLGLTGQRINAADALYCGIATHYCPSATIGALSVELQKMKNVSKIDQILGNFDSTLEQSSYLEAHRDSIDECFGAPGVIEIIEKLKSHADQEWASSTLKQLLSKSPTSLFETFKALARGASQTLSDALQSEFELSMRFMRSKDFAEGVRAVLIDKDNKPKWTHQKKQEAHLIKYKQLKAEYNKKKKYINNN